MPNIFITFAPLNNQGMVFFDCFSENNQTRKQPLNHKTMDDYYATSTELIM